MERDVNFNEISDGKLYGLNDLVKADCNDCLGCSACCHGMGNSIILDPYDIYRLSLNLGMSFEELLAERIELNLVDGTILPNLKMAPETDGCSFLNEEGRCTIHSFRPGICRLFPLGRFYENNSFQYFLQVNECKKTNKTKIKVKKWIDTPEIKKNEEFINRWHYFLKDIQKIVQTNPQEGLAREINLYVLNQFFMKNFDGNKDFYQEFEERMQEAEDFVENKIN